MFNGSYLFQFFGVLFRWLIINLLIILQLSKNNKLVSFGKVWKGLENQDDFYALSYDFTNIIIGAVFLFIICFIIFKYS